MLLTSRLSVRTNKPATITENHIKVDSRENAGRSSKIAFHQIGQSDGVASLLMLLPPKIFWATINFAIECSWVGLKHSLGSLDGFVLFARHTAVRSRFLSLWDAAAYDARKRENSRLTS